MTKTFFKTLRHAAGKTTELVRLLPTPYVGQSIQGLERDASELLLHLAQVPREELLLMQGLPKQEIRQRLRTTVIDSEQFNSLLVSGIDELEQFVEVQSPNRVMTNNNRIQLTLEAWCLETVMHLCHHRAQVYTHLCLEGISVPRSLLQTLFVGHL